MIRTYSGTQYIVRNANGNGELLERYETIDAAKEAKVAAIARETEYRKNNGYSILAPSKYVIVQSTWTNVYNDDEFISHTLVEIVIQEEH